MSYARGEKYSKYFDFFFGDTKKVKVLSLGGEKRKIHNMLAFCRGRDTQTREKKMYHVKGKIFVAHFLSHEAKKRSRLRGGLTSVSGKDNSVV